MKFWELASAMSSEAHVLEAALNGPQWAKYQEWYRNFAHLCDAQDREKLDAEVPSALAREVLSGSKQVFYLGYGQLRSYRFADRDQALSALEAFEAYGGKALVEALESGSFRVT